jgi:hypothetical protein
MIILIHMIFLNHENHSNHIKITVQTKEHGDRTVSRTDGARPVSTTDERSDRTNFHSHHSIHIQIPLQTYNNELIIQTFILYKS